ncbi:MAG: FAD-dependent oxidoreductase [bacterium]|jgi:heterodisulfide reductase subunit A
MVREDSKTGGGPGAPGREPESVAVALIDSGAMAPADLDRMARALKADPRVEFVAGPYRGLNKKSLEKLGDILSRRGVKRVLVAGASDRLFGRLIREALEPRGVDPSLVAIIDFDQAEGARTGRSRAERLLKLISASAASLAIASPIETLKAAIRPSSLVIGGGVAGIAAAAALARRGVKVTLVEKEKDLGGLIRHLNAVFPAYVPPSDFIRARLDELGGGQVEIIKGAEPVSMSGHVGDYEVKLSSGKTVEAGTIIVATGGALHEPHGLFGYGDFEHVITQMQLETIMKSGERPGENVVMIQCAGSRIPERPYCSRICCTASIKNTVLMKQKFPEINVTILSRGFAEYAGDLDRAREMGVEIIRYSTERPPVVGGESVEVYDEISDREEVISADRVVLAVPFVPSESTREVARVLRLPTDTYGFIIEPEPKLRPGEFVPRGIYVAGAAHWPATITDSVVQGYSAASRAFDLISQGTVSKLAFVSRLEESLCRGCGRCADACMHGAIELVEAEDGLKQAVHLPIQCTGCGVCVSVCPSGAFSLGYISSRQIGSIIEAIV